MKRSILSNLKQLIAPRKSEEGKKRDDVIIPPAVIQGTTNNGEGSLLREETKRMERERRIIEQDGHRKIAKVHAREHNLEEVSHAHQEGYENSILQNPWLNSQRFDGIDDSLMPNPSDLPLNSEARREFDNERREQEMEKQLRLGLAPKFNSAPKPQGPY